MVRNLILVLGDQLDVESAAFDDADPAEDMVWMAEVDREATHVPSHKARTALFLSAMRHFREALSVAGWRTRYVELDAEANRGGFAAQLQADVPALRPARVIVVQPGDWRVQAELRTAAAGVGVPLEIRPDRHFYTTPEEFVEFAEGRKELRMEFFYRGLRRRESVLMDGDEPAGRAWNFDQDNRQSIPATGPPDLKSPLGFPPDEITQAVLELVARRFPNHPGSLKRFYWPVTSQEADRALRDFVERRLVHFGLYQDAMWTGEPFLYHSRLSAVLNLKLLDPRSAVQAAEEAYRRKKMPLPAVEGFIRQILGWREYVRGVYWNYMPGYAEENALRAELDLPSLYWTGETDCVCLRESIGQTLEYGYSHHIQRLMVTGLFALLLGVKPKAIHEWFLAIHVDAVEWAELPNVIGMSQYADGGLMASKPYAASGKYIQRMSNYCERCRFNPAKSTGDKACPFTTLYWEFLMRHERTLAGNPRMQMQLRNLVRISPAEKESIRQQAGALRSRLAEGNV